MLLIIVLHTRVFYTFVSNKSFGQLLVISPEHFIFLKPFDSESSYIEVWFIDQNSNPLEIKDKINDILFSSTKRLNICERLWILSFAKNEGKNIGKNISKNSSSNTVRKFLIMLNSLLKMHLKLLQKSNSKNSRSNW